ncbi:transcription factor bHLH93 [Andrographis paniculata]|uniref:transcription factor bHLH93 n=1 Tax=Andrographis paniculata TaxID=175694 RepID=UPI0021E9A054|nr:transcription factor bHLH93 [Andrographis paniculata]
MELSQHSLFEELIMAPKMDTPFLNEYTFPNHWTAAAVDNPTAPPDHVHFPATNASLLELISPSDEHFNYPFPLPEFHPFLDVLTSPEYGSFYDKDDLPPMAIQEDHYAQNAGSHLAGGGILDGTMSSYYNAGGPPSIGESRSKSKKADGQPSKNLMAERRRRKRLNDRLSMLRSIVPKISKMDRTSILGDTIDYMRELLDKIQSLREEGVEDNLNQINPTGSYLKELKPNEMLVRNPPKFDVSRRNKDTRVEICCATKPGLLLSTLTTLDALGLEVQQSVISCFNDFSVQASCCEGAENQSLLSCEDIKQALFSNAGYGGRCL